VVGGLGHAHAVASSILGRLPPDVHSPAMADEFSEANRAWWDTVVPIHEASRGYDREGFLRGEKPLCPVELAELGPLVAGKSLLHLQCHFGMDTLSWARLGATVTGLDFSEPAIEAARRLSIEEHRKFNLGLPSRGSQSIGRIRPLKTPTWNVTSTLPPLLAESGQKAGPI